MVICLLCFTTGMLIGLIIGMCRMSLYFHKKKDRSEGVMSYEEGAQYERDHPDEFDEKDNYLEFGEEEWDED